MVLDFGFYQGDRWFSNAALCQLEKMIYSLNPDLMKRLGKNSLGKRELSLEGESGALPDVLLCAIRDLLPELLPFPLTIDKMNRFIFQDQSSGPVPTMTEISAELETVLTQVNRENLENFLIALEGMQIIAEEYHFRDHDEMTGYLEDKKDEVEEFLFGHDISKDQKNESAKNTQSSDTERHRRKRL